MCINMERKLSYKKSEQFCSKKCEKRKRTVEKIHMDFEKSTNFFKQKK